MTTTTYTTVKEIPIIPATWGDLFKRLDWLNVICFGTPHLFTIWGFMTVSWQWETFVLFLVGLSVSSTAFVVGYHRLWSHRTFVPTRSLEYSLAFVSTSAFQRTILWWARDHRAHHRHIDTDLDPCMANRGFWWRHLGWFLIKPAKVAPVDLTDLTSNPAVMWQVKWYWPMSLVTSFVVPMTIAGLGWGDWKGGLLYAGCLRINLVHNGTLFANSLAHGIGEKHFDDRNTPRDFFFTGIVTWGEGYHNYHHQFPMDYRVGTKWYHFDPNKWFVFTCYCMGLVTHISRAPENEVEKAKLTMELKKLRDVQERIKWPKDAEDLPVVDWETFKEQCKTRPLVIIAGFIHDVSSWIDEHPGGREMLSGSVGRDVTTSFFGGVYNHSNAAHNIMSMLRVGVLYGGVEHVLDHTVPPAQKLRVVHASELVAMSVN